MGTSSIQHETTSEKPSSQDIVKAFDESDIIMNRFGSDSNHAFSQIESTVEQVVEEQTLERKIEKNEKSFNESVHQSYIDMDGAFLEYLSNFNENVKQQEEQKLYLKKKFFRWIILFLAAIIFFPYLMVILFGEKATDITIITLSISSVAETLSAIIVLPKIIAKYLFNKKEDDNKIKIIQDMQTYNKEKRLPSEEEE